MELANGFSLSVPSLLRFGRMINDNNRFDVGERDVVAGENYPNYHVKINSI